MLIAIVHPPQQRQWSARVHAVWPGQVHHLLLLAPVLHQLGRRTRHPAHPAAHPGGQARRDQPHLLQQRLRHQSGH